MFGVSFWVLLKLGACYTLVDVDSQLHRSSWMPAQCRPDTEIHKNTHFADGSFIHVSGSDCCVPVTNTTTAVGAGDCCSRCEANPECEAWVLQPTTGKCWLGRGGNGPKLVLLPHADRVAGILQSRKAQQPFIQFAVDEWNTLLKSRREFPKLLNTQQPRGLAVILGVGNGSFALHLLDKWEGGGFYLVDPYIHIWKGYNDPANYDDKRHQFIFESLRNDIHKYEFRHSIIRDFSYSFAKFWRQKALPNPTFIYVDNNHAKAAVTKDLELWWDILAPGGIMAGSFYTQMPPLIEVKSAVDEFFGAKGLRGQMYFTAVGGGDPYPNWMVFKPLDK